MATKWVVTVPADRIELDGTRQGQITFTVTNPTDRPDRAVLDIVTSDGADPIWFTVDEPQRRVPPNGSVSYLVSAAVPGTVAAGDYSVQGRAYSADSTPEEDSVLSGRLALRVAAEPQTVRRRRPWWMVAVAGLAVVTVAVVLGVALGTGSAPTPRASGTPAGLVGVPDVAHQSEDQARTNLGVFGLRVGTVRHKLAAPATGVVYQSVAGGAMVPRGTAVDLVVTTGLAITQLTAPAAFANVPASAVAPPTTPVPTTPSASGAPTPGPTAAARPGVLRWSDPDPFVAHWQVTIQQYQCVSAPIVGQTCLYFLSSIVQVDHPWYTPVLQPVASANAPSLGGQPYTFFFNSYGGFQWQVAPVDDFGTVGPGSGFRAFLVQ